MRSIGRRSIACAAALAVALGLLAANAEAAQTPKSGLVFANGTGTKPLARATVRGTLRISLASTNANISKVTYYLNDPSGTRPISTAVQAPFNMARNGLDTTKLRNGSHTLLAVATTANGSADFFARFVVRNSGGRTIGRAPVAAAPKVKVGTKEVWRGDFETGDTSQWHGCEADGVPFKCGKGDGKKIRLVNNARQGKWAARFELNSGDVAASGERVELQNSKAPGPMSKEGDEYWFQWSTRFEPDFKSPTGGWFSILQWHDSGPKPPITVGVAPDSDKIVVTRAGNSQGAPTLGTVRRGQWTDFVLHIKFSKSDSGFIEGWENGKLTLPKYNRSTLITGENYLKMGIYRDKDDTVGKAVVTHDGMRVTAP